MLSTNNRKPTMLPQALSDNHRFKKFEHWLHRHISIADGAKISSLT
jgi:hypothetical protein